MVFSKGLNSTLVLRKQIEELGQAGYYFNLILSEVFRLLTRLDLVVF
jgi:hypothetical protein